MRFHKKSALSKTRKDEESGRIQMKEGRGKEERGGGGSEKAAREPHMEVIL